MPLYAYTARDSAGNPLEGTLNAASSEEVIKSLRTSGKYPVSIKLASETSKPGAAKPASRGIKISREEVIQFSQQIAIMVETGVTLAEALECCAMNVEKGRVRQLLDDLSHQVNNGSDFSTALSKHPRSFPRLYVALVRASEKSGKMSVMLNRANAYLRDEQEILRKVRGALTYPGIMFSFAVLTTIFLLAFVLPRFTVIYANKGAALPLPTKVLMAMSDFVVHRWMILVPAVLGIVGGIVFGVRTAQGKRVLDWLTLNLPAVGPMFRKLHLARGLRTIGTMAGSGVSLVECVETAQLLCNNSYFHELWTDVHGQIQNGKQFSEPLSKSRLVPGAISRMLGSGEKGGKLAMVMEQVSTFAEHELKEKIAELTRYIEPAMILLMGLLIGGVSMALLLPVFKISSVMAQ
ncbi:MAG: type II secretion system F family protein [Tepidisphaeraceae bacterium]